MKFFDDYKKIFGESFKKLFLSYGFVFLFLLSIKFYSVIKYGEFSGINDLAIIPAVFSGVLFKIGSLQNKVFSNCSEDYEERVKTIKDCHKGCYIFVSAFMILSIISVYVMSLNLPGMRITINELILNIEWGMLFISVIPLLYLVNSSGAYFVLLIFMVSLFSYIQLMLLESSVALLIILPFLIPVLYIVSRMIWSSSISVRYNVCGKSVQTDSDFLTRASISYAIYTGKKFSSVLMLYGIGILALFLFQLYEFNLIRDEANVFYTFASILEASLMASVSIVSFSSTRNLLNNMQKKFAYYLTVENRAETFKNYHHTLVILNLMFVLIFVITTYVAGAIVGILPSSWIMKFFMDLICTCLVYAALSFTVLIKKILLIFISGVLLPVAVTLLKIKVIPENLISLILIAVVAGFLVWFANKIWIKLLNNYYSEL